MTKLIITCEHAGNKIPLPFKSYFEGHRNLLNSHAGYDAGAYELFKTIIRSANLYHYHTDISRLLVDFNRSLHHPKLFSSITKPLPADLKREILKDYYLPYRRSVENKISKLIIKGHRIIHISVHSFTPMLNNKTRHADIGLLYDPSRGYEKEFCFEWRENLLKFDNDLNIRFNYPYRGISDGFAAYLRKYFPGNKYIGIELEVNQKYQINFTREWEINKKYISRSLQMTSASEFNIV